MPDERQEWKTAKQEKAERDAKKLSDDTTIAEAFDTMSPFARNKFYLVVGMLMRLYSVASPQQLKVMRYLIGEVKPDAKS